MPTTTTTTRQRNDQIRLEARNLMGSYPSSYRRSATISELANRYGLSETTIRNIVRGRDLNPPPSARNRSQRRAAGQTSRALGLSRRFGVEIEFFGVARHTVQRAIDTGAIPTGWKVKNDISVTGAGLELVSPPLSGEQGLASVRTTCDWLASVDAKVDRSCGLHVHHEARDLGAAGIARVARVYSDHQDLLNWLVSPSRRGGSQYARPLTNSDVEYIERSARGSYLSAPSRYLAVNVQSFGRHGTVEIRQHQGTLSFRKIEAWVRLGQGICDAAAQSTAVSETGLRGLFAKLDLDEDAASFLLGRAIQFGAPTTTVAA